MVEDKKRNNCLISIITVSLNSEKTIERTIKSVIEQDYPQIEYIIIDGGSIDGTDEIIKKYDRYIDFYVSEVDNGIYDAINKGLKKANGDLVGIINSDDYYKPKILKEVAKKYEKSESDVIYGDMEYVDNDESYYYKPRELNTFWFQMAIPHPTVFISKKTYEKYGYYSLNYKYASDYELLLRLYSKGVSFNYLNRQIAVFHAGGATNKNYLESRREKYEISNEYLAISGNRKKNELINDRIWANERFIYDNSLLHDLELNADKIAGRKIVLYGAGKRGKRLFILLEKIVDKKNITIVDSDRKKWGEDFGGVIIQKPQVVKGSSALIIITMQNEDDVNEIETYTHNNALKTYRLEDFITYMTKK